VKFEDQVVRKPTKYLLGKEICVQVLNL